jgi:hypothetical protein
LVPQPTILISGILAEAGKLPVERLIDHGLDRRGHVAILSRLVQV